MIKKIVFIILLLIALGGYSQNARDILEEADSAFKTENLYSVSEITITRNGKNLPIQMVEGYSTKIDGKNNSLSIYRAPKKMEGNANLMIGDNLWVKFASTGRVRKLSSSAKKNSSGGSDFSYADMGSGGEGMAYRYTSRLLGEKRIEKVDCYEIELTPTKDNESGYDKLIVYIEIDSKEYKLIKYYEDGGNTKDLYLMDYRKVDNISYPFHMIMKNNVKDSQTSVKTLELEVDSNRVTEDLFSQSYLKRVK